jgi:uncharacterized protein
MSHIDREIKNLLLDFAGQFRAVMVVGPRQSGKTTLVQSVFPNKPYVSLENPDERALALDDPRAFLSRFSEGAILDEIQRVPDLLNYLQGILDKTDEDGLFILTGSNNILLQESVSQSLAGRVGVLDLLPLSYREIATTKEALTLQELIFRGAYPEIYNRDRSPQIWYPSYIRTYVERDVRQIKNIENTALFTKFLKLCAGRVGQLVNLTALSNECGIDMRTASSWLSVLESTYVIRLLQPFHHNFNKRITKSSKLYFIDSGLACSLLGIRTTDELVLSHFKGALVENFIIMELIKNGLNKGLQQTPYYWRENNGVEVDVILDSGTSFRPIEIKSAQTFSKNFLVNLKKFGSYSGASNGTLLYDGEMEFTTEDDFEVLNWKTFFMR